MTAPTAGQEQVMTATENKVTGEHCPVPWQYVPEQLDPKHGRVAGRGPVLKLSNGLVIVKVPRVTVAKGRDPVAEANAAFIERAVNCHDDLLRIVKALAYWDKNADDERISAEGEEEGLYEICELARVALRKAESL